MKKLLYLLAALTLTACVDVVVDDGDPTQDQTQQERTWTGVGYFAANCMNLYYLWSDEVKSKLNIWLRDDLKTDPIQKVQSIRYKQGGKDFDRWTEVTDTFEEMSSGVQGVSTTYGCDIILMMMDNTHVCAVVSVVYASSPAAKAGLKRGDVIVRINGKMMTQSDYYSRVMEEFLYSASCKLTLIDGQEVSMTAVTMYEDPVVFRSVFDIDGKKVGYLVYNSFTTRSINKLLGVFEGFKLAGVTELILDLRYNGGGYVTTEQMLASMMAPAINVRNGDLFEQEVYNKGLTDYYIKKDGPDALKIFFKTQFVWKEGDSAFSSSCDSSTGHLDLTHLYAIVDSGTASASESLLVGLMPYLDVTLIGQQTHGKFCTGIMYGAQEWYDDYKDQIESQMFSFRKDVENWGLYVMVGRYADKDGNCPAMPDGLKPAFAVEDRPDLGYAFGDERDPMLRQALILAGRTDLKTASTRAAEVPAPRRMPLQVEKPAFGKRILTLDPS